MVNEKVYVSLMDAVSNVIMHASEHLTDRPVSSACEIGAALTILSQVEISPDERKAFVSKWRELPSWLRSSGNIAFAVIVENHLEELAQ